MIIKHVVSVSGGKDSLATLLIALGRCPRENITAIFCDTGNEHADTYGYLDYLEGALDIKIVHLKADFAEQIAAKRHFIARDQRTGREKMMRQVFDKHGSAVYARRSGDGAFVLGKDGLPVYKTRKASGRKLRWSNKAKRRALAVLYPSGNPFLDLCMWKGRFPSRMAQFCTQELKTMIAVEFQMGLMDAGYGVVSWQGIRRNESLKRANAKLHERVGPRLHIFRPIVDWTAKQVFDYAASHGIKPNPLYLQGMGRVGCMPCINAKKGELRAIAARFPEHPARIAEWERIVSMCSKHGFSTFMADARAAKDQRVIFAELNIWSRIEWSKTTRGGKQVDMLAGLEDSGCSSSYGLCDVAEPEAEFAT